MSTESNILVVAINSIKNDDIDLLDKSLRIMPLEKMDDNSKYACIGISVLL